MRVPKPITRKRAAVMGAGAGGALIAAKEVPKFFKVPAPMYGEEYVGKALSRSQIAALEATAAQERRSRRGQGPVDPNTGKPVERRAPGPNSLQANKAELARIRLERHQLGREKARAIAMRRQGLNPDVDFSAMSNKIAAGRARQKSLFPVMGMQVLKPPPDVGALPLAVEQTELTSEFPTIEAQREIDRKAAALNTAAKYQRAGRRGTKGGRATIARHHLEMDIKRKEGQLAPPAPPERDLDDIRRQLREQVVRNRPFLDEEMLRRPVSRMLPEVPGALQHEHVMREPLSYGAHPQASAGIGHHQPPALRHEHIMRPPSSYSADPSVAARRMPRGRLALIGAGAAGVGLTAEGVRRMLGRNKRNSHSQVRQRVRKDDWAEEQKYLQERERADVKRRRGANFTNIGAGMIGTTGLAGIHIPKKDTPYPKQYGIGNLWGKGGAREYTLFRSNKRRITTTGKPLLWAGTGAALLGAGAAHRISADRQDRRTTNRLNAELADEQKAAIAARDAQLQRFMERGART